MAEIEVLAERERQVGQEGWSEAHDDEHDPGTLATAAACYALNAACELHQENGTPLELGDENRFGNGLSWPWEPKWWKPNTPRRDLVKAAALILAEIERIDRAAAAEYRRKNWPPSTGPTS
jgi:hypothetical protein